MTTTSAQRPWLSAYDPGVPHQLTPELRNGVELFDRGVRLAPDAPALHYFDATLTHREADALAHELAAALRDELGVAPGDRVALMLQNVPLFPIAIHAAWLIGAIVTSVNPMNKRKELTYQLNDAGVKVILCHESLHEVVASVVDDTPLEHVVVGSELEFLDEVPPMLAASTRIDCPGAVTYADLVAGHAGGRVDPADPAPGDTALLTYTSGTTGPPKGAMNTHGGIVYNAENLRVWLDLGPGDVTVCMAPMFHITGLIASLAVTRVAPAPLLLFYRFDGAEMLRLVEKWRGTYVVGPLTAFISTLEHPEVETRDIASLTKVCAGGAPAYPAVLERFETTTGAYIHNTYGMTETTAPTHWTPMGRRAPVDAESGALSIGVPMIGVDCKVMSLEEEGVELPPGEIGQIVTRGPQVVPGYWEKPEESANAIQDGWMHSGDVGKRDENGWFFLVDRMKDMINVSGYKVWPRDVEEALYTHDAVLEACVVGVPDDYRGETVKAYVSLKPGATVTTDDLIAHCRSLLAVYKAPHQVEFVTEIPKTASGKALRRELRAHAVASKDTAGSP